MERDIVVFSVFTYYITRYKLYYDTEWTLGYYTWTNPCHSVISCMCHIADGIAQRYTRSVATSDEVWFIWDLWSFCSELYSVLSELSVFDTVLVFALGIYEWKFEEDFSHYDIHKSLTKATHSNAKNLRWICGIGKSADLMFLLFTADPRLVFFFRGNLLDSSLKTAEIFLDCTM